MEEFLNLVRHESGLPLENPVLIFALILFIILIFPVILRKTNIPGIVGLIISGVIIGPYGFGLIENSSAIDLFSTIGLLYIMFIAGLELDMNEFKTNKNKSFLFGFFTFILPLVIGFPVCYYLLGYGFNASFLTASMFATHTLVAYPIVSRLGVAKNQAVAVTVGGTILTDTAVLIILAVILGNDQGNLDTDFWIKLGISVIVFFIIMFYLIPKITRVFFQKLESEKHTHYIYVLTVVFFSAFLAEISGLEPIIGAFAAGLALNALIPQTSALMNRIEFIGNSLFIPFFLISVGMLVDVRVIFSGPMALLIAVVLTVVALLGKWLAAFFTQVIFNYSTDQRRLIFGLSSAHAAATIAVILVGYNAGILDENILNGTIILILITCIVASFATEKASKSIILGGKGDKVSEVVLKQIKKEQILLPIANFSNIEKHVEFILMIKDKKSVNPITLLSVVPNNAEAEQNIILAKKRLETIIVQGTVAEINVNTIATIDHNYASGILRISKEISADIIVLGWPKRAGVLEKFMGDKTMTIINEIHKTIFICFFERQLINQKRIFVITLPFAEQEKGFDLWLQKIAMLSQELSLPVVSYGSESTHNSIVQILKQREPKISISYKVFKNWENFLGLSQYVKPDDLLVLISARKNAVSYINFLENIPGKLERHFGENNKIVIYP